jgi:hypothetical protein
VLAAHRICCFRDEKHDESIDFFLSERRKPNGRNECDESDNPVGWLRREIARGHGSNFCLNVHFLDRVLCSF